jgi:two-component system response regulator FixJ
MNASENSVAEIVCLVDDDPAVLKSIGRLLASDGLSVQAFNEPKEFLNYITDHRVPVVILDIWMEEMNGLEVQAKLSRLSPRTRVIVITGRKDVGVEKTASEYGAAGFFIKPFDDEEFLGAVRAALYEPGSTNG